MTLDLNYRREIDGLRAFAVVQVILFHAGFSVFNGGYVGVDVFFVISGYLITSILIAELQKGEFSILRFYERRVRRILPALFVIVFSCLPFAYFWMLPPQLEDFSQSLLAVLTFSSNILFWQEEGYFAATVELKPLLHTWSLAVEEQYYLLFPIFMIFVWRFGRKVVFWTVIAITLVSFILAEWGSRIDATASFYLIPFRAWELFAGSLCAFLSVDRTPYRSNSLAGIGLAMIVFSIFAYDVNTPFPGIYAVVPVAGTVLVILFASQETWVAKLLSMRVFVGLGLISYSAYLWHQPLFAFARLRSANEPSAMLMIGLSVAALLLAWATWYFIEQPFRRKNGSFVATRRGLVAVGSVTGVMLLTAGSVGQIGSGNPFQRFDSRTVELIKSMESFDETWVNKMECRMAPFPENGKKNILVIGDSHSGDLLNALILAYGSDANFSSGSIFVGCGNLYLDRSRFEAEPDALDVSQCSRMDTYESLDTLIKGADYVFLSSGWLGFEAKFFGESWAILQRDYGDKFFVLGAKSISLNKEKLYRMQFDEIDGADFTMFKSEYNATIAKVAGDRYLDPTKIFCASGPCKLMQDGKSVYRDGAHVTRYGTQVMAEWLASWRDLTK